MPVSISTSWAVQWGKNYSSNLCKFQLELLNLVNNRLLIDRLISPQKTVLKSSPVGSKREMLIFMVSYISVQRNIYFNYFLKISAQYKEKNIYKPQYIHFGWFCNNCGNWAKLRIQVGSSHHCSPWESWDHGNHRGHKTEMYIKYNSSGIGH